MTRSSATGKIFLIVSNKDLTPVSGMKLALNAFAKDNIKGASQWARH